MCAKQLNLAESKMIRLSFFLLEHVVFLGKQERSSGLYPKEMSLSRSYRAKHFLKNIVKNCKYGAFQFKLRKELQ
jgi:hypothetical protein